LSWPDFEIDGFVCEKIPVTLGEPYRLEQRRSVGSRAASVHFPVFHRSTHLSRISESYGHWQNLNSSAAFPFEVPGSNLSLEVQELQMGGT
jgi:hypothetical protein